MLIPIVVQLFLVNLKLFIRNKMSRKRREKKEEKGDIKTDNSKTDLRKKLKEKLREKQLFRTSRFVRDNRMEKLEEIIDKSRDPKERRKAKEELELLTKIEEYEENYNDDHPEYNDATDGGGGCVHDN